MKAEKESGAGKGVRWCAILWKLFAFAFDVALVRKEASELVEKSEEQKKKP